jgi:2-polyprenyl-6-methoxyphenol hydroxylase-like FAD-dependent oxidoreductase
MVASQSKIGIIGAGSSGLYLGILLTQQGYQVDIFEKSPDIRTTQLFEDGIYKLVTMIEETKST